MVLTVLLLLKIMLFIYLTRIEYNKVLIFIVSSLYIVFFFSLIYFSNKKKKQAIAFSFYNIISAIMFADTMYFHYFNGMPSIKMLKQLGQVAAVGDSVKSVLNPLNILFLIDIPFLCFYSSQKKKKLKKSQKIYNRDLKIGIPYVIISTLSILMIMMYTSGYGSIISKQELFTYHAKDIVSIFKDEGEAVMGEELFTNEDLRNLRERASTIEGKYTGIGKDKNLIVIQVEALQNFALNRYYEGKEITPNLNAFLEEQGIIYFDRYYQLVGLGSTSDAEFVTLNSLYPSMKDPSYNYYKDKTFYGLPWILRNEGYTAWSFHGYKKEFWSRNTAHKTQGFERLISEEDYEVGDKIVLGITDEDFLDQTVPYIKQLQEPYFSFVITLSSHNPFNLPEKYKEIDLKPEHENTLFGNYIQSIHYADKALGQFLTDLKEEGLYDDTVIALYGDHFALSSMDEENVKIMTDYMGKPYDFDEMMNIPLIIHVPEEEINETISTVGSQIDFLPTILNIMGIKNEKGVMFGVDLANSNEGIVAQQIHMLKGSFIDNEKMFVMSRDGIFDHSRAIDLYSGRDIDLMECRDNYERALAEIDKCEFILQNNLIKNFITGSNEIILEEKEDDFQTEDLEYVALGGGEIEGVQNSNSLDAIDESYKNGFRCMELNFQWTSDEKLVLLQDWEGSVKKLFNVEPKKYSLEEFKSFVMINGLKQMTLEDLASWMRDHIDAYIITTIKEENVKALKYIRDNYPDIQDRIIPQIRYTGEYYPVLAQKYRNIIFNLSLGKYSDEEVIDFLNIYKHFAVVMPVDKAKGDFPQKLKEQGVRSYAYVVGDEKAKERLGKNGVFGFYTHNLAP
ncbi:sulfatase-like hydrolase/transferase [Anaerosalibacter sp. Marseille-P3206]|uniref:sulfatase-like hydrolase/transferase n=1 Tax=Anaerosalibacter sp. Marseille-P3206 TaxID=1871005 RepID=UPI0009845324|nr:sulfatase-like hydrolase/transferase [Anaerosalibacter sp. Marseille-P3206]